MRREELLTLAARLAKPYRISPPRPPAGGPAGVFTGFRDGQSVDFHDFREYQPGDDLRRVDWLAYARTGQMHLRLFREEVSPIVELHLDTSASMDAYSGKEQIAFFLTAFLRLATLAAEGRPVLCRNGRRFAGGDFEAALLATEFSGKGEDGASGPQAGGVMPIRFFLSDFLFADGISRLFHRHAAGCLHFCPIMLLSRSESDPPWRGAHRFREVEHDEAAVDLIVTEKMAAKYRERLRRHEDGISRLARRHGATLLRIVAPDGDVDGSDLEEAIRLLAEERVVTVR